jgi:hypothetical protein
MLEKIRELKDQVMAEYEQKNAVIAETMTPEQLALCGGGWGQVEPDSCRAREAV